MASPPNRVAVVVKMVPHPNRAVAIVKTVNPPNRLVVIAKNPPNKMAGTVITHRIRPLHIRSPQQRNDRTRYAKARPVNCRAFLF